MWQHANYCFWGHDVQSNEGGVSQTGDDQEQFSSGKGNALLGGDLKDSRSNENAAQNNVSAVYTCFHLASGCVAPV